MLFGLEWRVTKDIAVGLVEYMLYCLGGDKGCGKVAARGRARTFHKAVIHNHRFEVKEHSGH